MIPGQPRQGVLPKPTYRYLPRRIWDRPAAKIPPAFPHNVMFIADNIRHSLGSELATQMSGFKPRIDLITRKLPERVKDDIPQ